MRKTVFLGALALSWAVAGPGVAGVLDDVKARGKVVCGVNEGLVGFASKDANGAWEGFDVAMCRAVAAAVLGDPTAVTLKPTPAGVLQTSFASGELDLLARNTTWTFGNDVDTEAEFVGVTSANVGELAAQSSNNPEINRLLGTEGELGKMLGLPADWAVKAIQAGGNYGEIFEKNIGENTPIGLARGLNAQWTNGGLLYALPFR